MREILWKTQFNIQRLKICVGKLLSDMPAYKRKGEHLSRSILYHDNFNNQKSNHGTLIFVKQQKFLKQVQKELSTKGGGNVISQLTKLRDLLYKTENLHVQVVGDMRKIKNAKALWLHNFLPATKKTKSSDEAEITPTDVLTMSSKFQKLHNNGENRGYIFPCGAIETGYLNTSCNSISTFDDERWASLLVTVEYLTALEGPFWKKIRGLGLSYGYSITPAVDDGLIYFSLSKSTDVGKAFEAAKDIVTDILTKKEEISQVALECARSTVICDIVSRENTADAAAMQAFFHYIRGVGPEYNRNLLTKVQKVSEENLRKSIEEFIAPLFSTERSNMVIVLNPVKLKETIKFFQEKNIPLKKIDSLDNHICPK